MKAPSVEALFPNKDPTVGLVIGTFAGLPYLHLSLESWRRNYPSIPVLVSDGGSPNRDELRALAAAYGADFISNRKRKRWTVGDVSAYLHGLQWAAESGLELLVKMSRRFIPLHNWVPVLQCLAYRTQYATFSNRCTAHNFGFRTECIGFHVKSWSDPAILNQLRKIVNRNKDVFVEVYIHDLARKVHRNNCRANQRYEKRFPRSPDSDAYGIWKLMASKRTRPKPGILWHNANEIEDYYYAARSYGLPHPLSEFIDVNQGFGRGPK